MVKNKILSFIIIGVTAWFFMVSAGFQLFSHHCNKTQSSNYSIIAPAEQCTHNTLLDEVNSDCCHTEQTTPQACKSDNHNKDNGCCNNAQVFIKLVEKTIIINATILIKTWVTQLFDFYIPFKLFFNEIKGFSKTFIHDASPPPPKVSKFLSYIQVYLR